MHRVYQPLLPTANKYLQEKWDEADYRNHRKKVELAVPVVSTKAAPTPFHLQVNLKKIQLEKERRALWDRENLLHSAKLWDIKQSQGRVDNWNAYCIHSLNGEKRRQDLGRISWENQQLLKRLEGRKSELAQERWQDNWHKEEALRHRIAHHPRGWGRCQPKKERQRQQMERNGRPTSAAGGSPVLPLGRGRPILRNTKNTGSVLGKSFCGGGSESRLEGLVAAAPMPSTTALWRKKDGADAPGGPAQGSSEGSSAEAANGSPSKRGTSTATTEPHAASSIRKSLRLPENRLLCPGREETPEASLAWHAGMCSGGREKGPRPDKTPIILWTSVPAGPCKLSARKSPEGNGSRSHTVSPNELLSGSPFPSANSGKSSLSLVKAGGNSPCATDS